MTRKLTCPEGHEWDPTPSEVHPIIGNCPICGQLGLFDTLAEPIRERTDEKETVQGSNPDTQPQHPQDYDPHLTIDPPVESSGQFAPLIEPPPDSPSGVSSSEERLAEETLPAPTTTPETKRDSALNPPDEPSEDSSASGASHFPGGETLQEPPTLSQDALAVPTREESEKTAQVSVKSVPHPDQQRGSIPGYEVLGELGRGGMGVVYKARQQGANRLVALKMILGGAHVSVGHRRRFYTEAEAVARLQHPNIVQLFDVGEHLDQPYFSLEFVEGGCLTEYLDGTPWPGKEAAALTETISRAMHYAHEQDIVHRDLKPANVLVSRSDEPDTVTPEGPTTATTTMRAGLIPKITDFGLAKLMEVEDGQTRSGDVLGTPSYMAPEQAEGWLTAIGRTTDVYALGAILYQLLTGRPPFKGTTLLETLEQVRAQDPVPVRRLNFQVPNDLETICLKCLQKEQSRRYPTALELAEDLQRFQKGEPIKARPVSRAERSWRWCRRNPKVAALISTLIAVMVTAFVTILSLLVQTRAAEERATQNLRLAEQAVNDYFTDISENELLNEPGMKHLRVKLLARAEKHYRRFIKENENNPALQEQSGLALFRLAQVTAEIKSQQKGIELHKRGVRIFELLVKSEPDKAEHRYHLAKAHHHLGRLYRQLSQMKHSERHYHKALAFWTQLRKGSSQNKVSYSEELARTQMGLGNVYAQIGDLKSARKFYEEALENRPDLATIKDHEQQLRAQRDRGTNLDNLAEVYYRLSLIKKGRIASEHARKDLEQLVKSHPSVAQYREDFGRQLYNAGRQLHRIHEHFPAAQQALEGSTREFQAIIRLHPTVAGYQEHLARSLIELGQVLRLQEKIKEAEKAYQDSSRLLEKLIQKHPEVPDYKEIAIRNRVALADLYRSQSRFADSKEILEKANKMSSSLQKTKPELPAYNDLAASVQEWRGITQSHLKETKKATEHFHTALRIRERLIKQNQLMEDSNYGLALCQVNLAHLELDKENAQEAKIRYDTAIKTLESLLKLNWKPRKVRTLLSDAYTGMAMTLKVQKKYAHAVEAWDKVRALSGDKESTTVLRESALCILEIALKETRSKNYDKAKLNYDLALTELTKLLKNPAFAQKIQSDLLLGWNAYAFTLEKMEEYEQALVAWGKVIQFCDSESKLKAQLSQILCRSLLARQLSHQRKWDKAKAEQATALKPFTDLNEAQKNLPIAKSTLGRVHHLRGQTLLQTKEYAAAEAELKKAVLLQTQMSQLWAFIDQTSAQAGQKQYQTAVQVLDQLRQKMVPSTFRGKTHYRLAIGYVIASNTAKNDKALTPNQQNDKALQLFKQAMTLLQSAKESGWHTDEKLRGLLQSDACFDGVRDTREFRTFLEQLTP